MIAVTFAKHLPKSYRDHETGPARQGVGRGGRHEIGRAAGELHSARSAAHLAAATRRAWKPMATGAPGARDSRR
jgi:hypothetical protein